MCLTAVTRTCVLWRCMTFGKRGTSGEESIWRHVMHKLHYWYFIGSRKMEGCLNLCDVQFVPQREQLSHTVLPVASCYMQQQSLFLVAVTRTITLCGQKSRLFCVEPTLPYPTLPYVFLKVFQISLFNFMWVTSVYLSYAVRDSL